MCLYQYVYLYLYMYKAVSIYIYANLFIRDIYVCKKICRHQDIYIVFPQVYNITTLVF